MEFGNDYGAPIGQTNIGDEGEGRKEGVDASSSHFTELPGNHAYSEDSVSAIIFLG